ncbi:MAG: sulfatase-like hydrolase/transferase [Oscillospiraceae bacterium]|nr:sulfatase-like hydrolase/transferase [Oscillospiraceae bacterium]
MKYLKEKIYKTSPWWVNALATVFVPLICLFTGEWIHRGSLNANFWMECFWPHFIAFFLAGLFLILVYGLISQLTGWHWLATLCTAVLANVPAAVSYFKLQMRGEPFLPWDILQLQDFLGVAGNVKLVIQPSMIITLILMLALCIGTAFIHLPYQKYSRLKGKVIGTVSFAILLFGLVFGVFLQSKVTFALGIYPDMWMQDRYYRNHGVITGFLTNLQALAIHVPDAYSENSVQAIQDETQATAKTRKPLYAHPPYTGEKAPNIIYVMNESFWDVSRLPKIAFSEDLTPNLQRLADEGAYGYCYSPSFGGGTCDVEFEALTGFSMEHLPAGAKPFQQHVTRDMFSLPQYLKASADYQTVAIHGYYRRMWSRDKAYPRLGIDKFISVEDMSDAEKRRGFVSDAEMTRRIIAEYERRDTTKPMFIHAVTMQNHTTYSESNYPEDELVQIVDAPASLSQETLGQLRDFATGVQEADAALGELVGYFKAVDEPTIIVFWGDHFNPVGEGWQLYEDTGFTQEGEGSASPALHETDLRIWSNFDTTSVNLGTIAAYNISPVMMELYGLDKPVLFEFLAQQMPKMRSRSRGVTVSPNGSKSEQMTQEQTNVFENHAILQYDLMFGDRYLQDYTSGESDTAINLQP